MGARSAQSETRGAAMAWDPEEEFVRQELAYRRDRDRDALVLDPNSMLTSTPLGQPSQKLDGGAKFQEVRRCLGLDRRGVSLVDAVKAFAPESETLAFLAEIVFDEFEPLAKILSSVDPVRLPTIEQRGIQVLFTDPNALTAPERQGLGDHIPLSAVQYVREREAFDSLEEMAAEPRYYFVDRNLARAYEMLYSPWLVIWLYGFAIRCVPRSAENLLRWRGGIAGSTEPIPRANKVLSGPRFNARLARLLAREHFLQSCLWHAILQCRAGRTVMERGVETGRKEKADRKKRRGPASEQVKTWIRNFWELRRHLAGARLSVHERTMQLLDRGDVPRHLVRAFTLLADELLYDRGATDPKVLARLDGVTQVVVEACQQLESDEAKKTLSLALLETPNVERIFGRQAVEITRSLEKGPARSAFLDEYWSNAPVYFSEAIKAWRPPKHGPFNAFLSVFLSNKSNELIRTRRKRMDGAIDYIGTQENANGEDGGEQRLMTLADQDSNSPNLMCRPFFEIQAQIAIQERQQSLQNLIEAKELTKTQQDILREFYKALQEVDDQEEARKIAAERLGLTAGNFRTQLSYARKTLIALKNVRP